MVSRNRFPFSQRAESAAHRHHIVRKVNSKTHFIKLGINYRLHLHRRRLEMSNKCDKFNRGHHEIFFE